jgi:hypothetical protein
MDTFSLQGKRPVFFRDLLSYQKGLGEERALFSRVSASALQSILMLG